MIHRHFARELRLDRLYRHSPSGLMLTPLDHAISDGPLLPPGRSFDDLLEQLALAEVDAVVVHKGMLHRVRPHWFTRLGLIMHLSASTGIAPDPDAKCLVTGVEEAIRLGADAVSVHVNLGSLSERAQLGDLGRVAEACDRWNMPLLAMVYPRGPHIADPADPALVAQAVTVATDLGADLVKTVFPGSVEAMREITAAAPIPVLVAGGPSGRPERETLAFVSRALAGGAGGVAMGRTVFQSHRPAATARAVSALVHRDPARPVDASAPPLPALSTADATAD